MSGIEIDDSELRELYVDLSRAPLRTQFNVASAVRKGAEAIDKQMTVDATGHMGNWFGIRGTEFETPLQDHVSHEMLTDYEAEIGIESQGAGKLAHIIVYGSVNNAPVYDHMAGPRRALPQVAQEMANAGEESVFGRRGKAT